uniref:Fibroblast activation protein alpha n=1 Tax=Strix occidentalis caurina TaxID=311401 RepID=A0A8D0FFP9_STROC
FSTLFLPKLSVLFLVVNTDDGPRALTLEDYLNGNFQYKTFFPYWVSDNEYLHQSAEDDIILYNVEMNYPTTIMTNSTMKQVNASNYVLSSDKYFIALESNYSKVIILIYCLMKFLVSFSILLIVVAIDKCFLVLF